MSICVYTTYAKERTTDTVTHIDILTLCQCQSPTHLSTNKYGCPSKAVFTLVVLWNLIAYTRKVHSRALEFFHAHCVQHNQSFSFMICLCKLSGMSLWRVTVTVSLQEG